MGGLHRDGSRFGAAGQGFLWCFWAVGQFKGLVVLRSCSNGVQQPPPPRWWKWLAGLLGKQGALPQGSQNWQDCPTMEADFAQLGRVCSIISGLQDFSRGLAVLCTAPQGCSSSRGQGRENP